VLFLLVPSKVNDILLKLTEIFWRTTDY